MKKYIILLLAFLVLTIAAVLNADAVDKFVDDNPVIIISILISTVVIIFLWWLSGKINKTADKIIETGENFD